MAEPRGGQQRIPRPASFRAGEPPPWAALPADRRRFSRTEVRSRLAALPPAREAVARVDGSRAAAVLVPLYEAAGETYVVLIKRPDSMPSHKGEIAFPGGKVEATDDGVRATALREAHEEIGLSPDAVEVVAQLDGIGTVASRFTITPFVGFLAARPALDPNPREVVRVLEVPLSELLDPAWFHEERWDIFGTEGGVFFFDLADETIWGATARILTSFLAHLVEGR